MHRYCVALPSPARTPAQAGASLAYAQVARPHHTRSRARRAQSRGGCAGLCGFIKSEDKKWCAALTSRLPDREINDFAVSGPGYGEFRTDYEPILARVARSLHGPNGSAARAAIVDHGNPGAWHGTSATAPATTVACTNDAEVLDGLLGVLDTHDFVFARLMGLADALGCTWRLLSTLHSVFDKLNLMRFSPLPLRDHAKGKCGRCPRIGKYRKPRSRQRNRAGGRNKWRHPTVDQHQHQHHLPSGGPGARKERPVHGGRGAQCASHRVARRASCAHRISPLFGA